MTTIYDWGALALFVAIGSSAVLRFARGADWTRVLQAVTPASIGCVVTLCAGHAGHPVLAGVMGLATAAHILHAVWREPPPTGPSVEGRDR